MSSPRRDTLGLFYAQSVILASGIRLGSGTDLANAHWILSLQARFAGSRAFFLSK